MAVDKELDALLKKANKRIDTLQRSYNNIYQTQVNEMIARLERTAENLTGTTGHLKRGNIKEADIPKYKRALNAFLESELSTITGQNRVMNESKAKFEKKYGKISESEYKTLTDVFESDEFKRFKETYRMYANVLSDMTANGMTYDDAVDFIRIFTDPKAETNEQKNIDVIKDLLKGTPGYEDEKKLNAVSFTYADGSLNIPAFIDAWKAWGNRGKI